MLILFYVFQVQERSAHALGYLLVGEPQFVHRQRLIDGLCEAGKVWMLKVVLAYIPVPTTSVHRYPCHRGLF